MNHESITVLSKLSHLSKELEFEQILLFGKQDAIISSENQPANGTVYIAALYTQTITLPLTANFKNYGSRIIIIASNTDVKLLLASEYSNDILIYNQEAYSNNSLDKIISNRGFVELLWTSSGWYVLNSCGFTITSPP